jgi:hypothetical protein
MSHRIATFVGITLTVLLVSSAPLLAADDQKTSSGTIIEVDVQGGKYTVKDYDGKVYELDKTYITEENLKAGDAVEYELIESKPAHVKRKK